jgi:hypothetical protein
LKQKISPTPPAARKKSAGAPPSLTHNASKRHPILQTTREIVNLSILQNIFVVDLVSYPYSHDKRFLKIKSTL